MLRITVQEDGTVWRLHLAGRLASAWVGETENIWHTAQPFGKQVEIDMREVTGIDEAGRCLLRAMNKAGARLIARGVAMEALVEEIKGKQANGNRRPSRSL
jgi:predicted phage gp36 major capsid-like protein